MESKASVYEGRTLDDAVRRGLEALGLSRAEVMITVVEEGSGGFLGLGSRPYRVRVMPRPGGAIRELEPRGGRGGRARPERAGRGPERRGVERGGRDSRRGRSAPDDAGRGYGGGAPARHEGAREERRDARRPGPPARSPEGGEARAEARPVRDDRRFGERRPDQVPAAAEGAEGDERRRRRRGRRGGRGRVPERYGAEGAGLENAASAGVEQPPMAETADRDRGSRAPRGYGSGEERAAAPGTESPGITADELASLGQRFTADLLKAMGFEARITAQAEASRVDVTAEVQDDEELLTGRKGEVRQALQHLLNRLVNRGEGSRYHVQLEINDFWQRRENELRELAHALAEEAVTSGGERLTEYLNAQERRIVHVTLKEDARVKTYAIGDGLIKKVAVAPADYPEGPRDEA
jgi:spoIIIJ-associated protein